MLYAAVYWVSNHLKLFLAPYFCTIFLALSLPIVSLFAHPKTASQVKILDSPLSKKIGHPSVTSILKASDGLLWIGTQRGLYRFDGFKLIRYSTDSEDNHWIPASFIQEVSEDKSGNIIIATYGGGVLRLHSESTSFEPIFKQKYSKLDVVNDTHIGSGNIAWIATNHGLYAYALSTTNSNQEEKIHKIETGEVSSIGTIASDISGNVYFSSRTSVYRIKSKHEAPELILQISEAEDSSDWITSLTSDSKGELYIGTVEGLLVSIKLDPVDSKPTILWDRTKSISISDLLIHNNSLWVATNHGLYQSVLNTGSFKSYFSKSSPLSSNDITTLIADDDKIWIGTFSGVNTISYGPFQNFNQANSRVFDDVQAFSKGNDQDIWVGTFNGLFRLDPELGTHVNFDEMQNSSELDDQRIMSMASTNEELWLGFQRNGIQILDLNSLQTIPVPADILTQIHVASILHTGKEVVWIASFDSGLFRVEKEAVNSYISNGRLPEQGITIVTQTASEEIIVSTERKIYVYRSDTDDFKLFDHEFLLGDRKVKPLILSIAENANGDLWIGTKEHGLFIWPAADRFEGNHTLRQSNLLSNSNDFTIYAIEFDKRGYAWCSTQDGIIKLDSNGELLAQFGVSDGLQGPDFNFGASFQDSSGRIYFGGSQGYNRFDPSTVDARDDPPDMSLLEIAIPGTGKIDSFNARNINSVQLTHKDYFVQFVFSVLDFLDPEKNIYRYMLEGFDPNWIDNGNSNTASYTRLPPGDYTLKVQGANSAGVWNREGLTIGVEVLPPPWLTWWAYLFYGLTALFVGWMGKRIYDSYAVERRAKELAVAMVAAEERAEDEMVEQLELHDELVKSVYRHNVSTLTIIEELLDIKGQSVTDDDARELTNTNISRVKALRILEDCLYYQEDKLFADLNRYTQVVIDKLLETFPLGAEAITTINEVDSKIIPFELASPVAIIMYELLENIVAHAFEGDGPHYIHVRLQAPEVQEVGSLYHLVVEDNGCGLPANVDVSSTDSSGLATVNAMAKRLSGEIGVSVVNGTSITLTFPPIDR
ncbi:MAG: two-component regulator propeller domain-containing protein [Pseudomonadota bacterium]